MLWIIVILIAGRQSWTERMGKIYAETLCNGALGIYLGTGGENGDAHYVKRFETNDVKGETTTKKDKIIN